MPLRPLPCPFDPKLMVVVLQMEISSGSGDHATGVAVIEVLTPEDRLQLFSACHWYKENPDWDRWTYEPSQP